MAVIQELTRRLREMDEQASSLSFQRVKERTKGLFLRLAQDPATARGPRRRRALTHQQIADMIGTSRETVTRVVKELKQDGWLQQEGKRYLVPARGLSASVRPGGQGRARPRRYGSVAQSEPAFAGALVESHAVRPRGDRPRRALAALNAGRSASSACPGAPLDAALGRDCREALRPQPTVCRLLLEALDGRERPEPRGARARARGVAEPRAPSASPSTPCATATGASRARRSSSATSRPSSARTSRSGCASGSPRSARWPPASPTRSAIRSPGWRCSRASCGAGSRASRRSSRSWRELTGELRTLADTVTASLEFVRPARAGAHARRRGRAARGSARRSALARCPSPVAIERDYEAELPQPRRRRASSSAPC